MLANVLRLTRSASRKTDSSAEFGPPGAYAVFGTDTAGLPVAAFTDPSGEPDVPRTDPSGLEDDDAEADPDAVPEADPDGEADPDAVPEADPDGELDAAGASTNSTSRLVQSPSLSTWTI